MSHVSDIKLIRTDTTLDLSQKAEKGMLGNVSSTPFYSMSFYCPFHMLSMWDNTSQFLSCLCLPFSVFFHKDLKSLFSGYLIM